MWRRVCCSTDSGFQVTIEELEAGCSKSVEHKRKVFGPDGLKEHPRRFKVEVYRGDVNNSRY